MHGLYSYNVLDSPEFIQAKKIERRIATYDRKTREKMARDGEKARQKALELIRTELAAEGGDG